MLRALAYRNYRLFFGGQLVSLVGTWLSMVASNWLVYRLASENDPTTAPMVLGIVGFAGQLPVFLLTPLAGVWIDRWNRHRLLMATQTLAMFHALALGLLVLFDVITIPQILVLNALQGLVNAFDIPARQSFVVDIIENREDLGNAIALNSSMVHLARLLGPVTAGMLIYFVGEAFCFLIDGASYIAVLTALAMMRVSVSRGPPPLLPPWRSLVEGFSYGLGFRPLRVLLLMTAITSLMVMSQSVLMPLYADRILAQPGINGELLLGLLLGASGVGALTGSLYLASRRTVLGLGRVIAISGTSLGIGLALFAYSPVLWLSLPLLVICGGATVVQIASCNTLLQTIVDDDKRGRVMSLFTMAFMGMAPFGSLLAGTLAARWGAPATLALAGIICLGASSFFALALPRLRPLVRPIYQRKGILPEVALGMQASAAQAASAPE